MTKKERRKNILQANKKLCHHTYYVLHQTLPTARFRSFTLLRTCEGPNVHLSCLCVCSKQHVVRYKMPRKTTKKQTPDLVFPELVPRKIEPVSAAFGDDNSRHGCQMNLGRAW